MSQLARRSFLKTAGLFSLAPLALSQAGCAHVTPPNIAGGMQFDDPQHNLDALIRLRGGTDNVARYTIGTGRAFAVFEDEIAIPLFDAKAVQWERNERLDDGSYKRQNAFVQYHYNLDGSSADDWTNPITSEKVSLPVFKNEFGEVTFTTRGAITPPEMQVTTLEGDEERIYPWIVIGDDVWLPKDEMARYYSAREERFLIENSTRTYHASMTQLNDLSLPSVESNMVESAISQLFSFLNIPKEKSGFMLWRFVAKKVGDPDNLPSDIRREIDEKNPELWNTSAS